MPSHECPNLHGWLAALLGLATYKVHQPQLLAGNDTAFVAAPVVVSNPTELETVIPPAAFELQSNGVANVLTFVAEVSCSGVWGSVAGACRTPLATH